jgi:hypothetical protein
MTESGDTDAGTVPADATPTHQDIENARRRQQIAARQAEEYAEVERLASEALGPGWTPWMKLSLIDSDHRRTGNTEPVATVYKVYRGDERLTEHSAYVRRMPDGEVLYADTYEPLFGELLQEKHPTRTVEVRGQRVPVDRYELCWSALELYEPKSAEELAASRATRERKAEARAVTHAMEANPLFAEQIRSGAWRPEKKRRGRSPG